MGGGGRTLTENSRHAIDLYTQLKNVIVNLT